MAPKPPNLLFLLPMPLTTAQKKKLIKYLTTALLTYSMDEIVEQELDRIYSWPTMPNSKTKKLYKNYTLVYSRAELKNLLLVTYHDALGTTVPDPADDEPLAEDDSIETTANTPISGDLSSNDVQSSDGGNVWSLVTGAVNGIVVLNPDGSYTYTPNAGFIGTDSFTYQLCDADGDCSTATITITVTALTPVPVDNVPIAVGGSNSTIMDTPVSGDLSVNDTPSADGGNEWSLVENASDGTVILNANGIYTYTPGSGFVGTDSFKYQLCDADGDCSTATVTITVTSNPDIPIDSTEYPTEDPTDTWIPPILLDPAHADNLPIEESDEMAELAFETENALEEAFERLDVVDREMKEEILINELADRYTIDTDKDVAAGFGLMDENGKTVEWTAPATKEEMAERVLAREAMESQEFLEAIENSLSGIQELAGIVGGWFGGETGGGSGGQGGGRGGGGEEVSICWMDPYEEGEEGTS